MLLYLIKLGIMCEHDPSNFLLHQSCSRAIAIRDIVSRYLPLEPKTEEEVQTERFLVEKLKLPLQWIREAKVL